MKTKLIYLLIVLVVLEIITGIIYLKKKPQEGLETAKVTQKVPGPKLSLSPESGNFKVNQPIEVKVLIDTKGKSLTGADSVINYNPEEIEIVGEPTTGKIFPYYLYAKVKKEKKIVDISATITDPSQPAFTGIGEFASFTVKPLKTGKINLTFEFIPGKTNESNLSEKGTSLDVLTEVTNATFNVTP